MTDYGELIAQLEDTADKYASVIEGASFSSLVRRPDEKEWAPVEIICHMRDIEEITLNRFQTMLVIEEFKYQPAEADRWAADRQYLRNDPLEALSAFRKRREETLEFLKTLKPDQWERSGIHSKRGRISIADTVKLMVHHGNEHLEQLKRAFAGSTG